MQNYYWWNSYGTPYTGMNPPTETNDYISQALTTTTSQKFYEDLE